MSVSEAYECTFNWIIENFSYCFQKNDEFISSPIFLSDCFGGRKWRMKLYPKGRNTCENYISLFLSRCDDKMDEKEISVNEKWELIIQDAQLLGNNRHNNRIYKNNDYRGYDGFFSLKQIHDKIEKCGEDKLTIRCHIRRSESKFCNAITRICVDQYSFQWKIVKPNSYDWLEHKKIFIQDLLQLQIDITAPEDDVLIKINKQGSKSSSSLFMKCKVSLLNEKGHKIKFKIAEHLYDNTVSTEIWQFPLFIKKSELETEADNIFKDGAFTLDWEFSYSKDVDSYGDYTVSTLKDDLGEMLRSKKHSDVQLKSENAILSAHKSILSARSPVFSAMFDQNMTEKKSGIVDIVDCDSRTLTLFVEYLYNDVFEISDSETALKLLLMAEKYQALTLKELCISFLLVNLNVENVCEILVAADMIGHKHLKSSVLKFIKSNPKNIFSSPEGRKWIVNNPNLAVDIMYLFF